MKIGKKFFIAISIAGITLMMISPLNTAKAAYSRGTYTNNMIVYKPQSQNVQTYNYQKNYMFTSNGYKIYSYASYYTYRNSMQLSNATTIKTPVSGLNNSNTAPNPVDNVSQTYSGLSQEENKLANLINYERTSRKLSALTVDENLSKVARIKAQDMKDNNYFSHTSPTYGSPFDMIKKFGITYYLAGENIAKNRDVVSSHYAFMNSDGHRANILNPYYNKVGIGVVKNKEGNGVIVVEMFIKD